MILNIVALKTTSTFCFLATSVQTKKLVPSKERSKSRSTHIQRERLAPRDVVFFAFGDRV